MTRIIIYGSKEDFEALEGIGTALSYLSRRIYKEFELDINVRRENLVFCYENETPRTIFGKMFFTKRYEDKPETIINPKAIIALRQSKTLDLEQLAKAEKIPFLRTSAEEIRENSD